MITVGQHWETGRWRHVPREVVVDFVDDIGVDEVRFHFTDREQSSRCSTAAFLRVYVECAQ